MGWTYPAPDGSFALIPVVDDFYDRVVADLARPVPGAPRRRASRPRLGQ
jgi:hypothetical protein